MSYKKPETGETKKEVISIWIKPNSAKQLERAKLLEKLKDKWQYANNTCYCNTFRKYKIIEMIREITFFIHDDQQLFLENERYILLSLIRALSYFTGEKSPANKRAVVREIKNLETLS